jgi:hypothetical protein
MKTTARGRSGIRAPAALARTGTLLASAAILLGLAIPTGAVAAAPAASVRAAASHTETSDTTCGTYAVHLVKPIDDSGPKVGVTVTAPGGTKVVDWSGEDGASADVFWCRDVNADGIPELGYGTFSGGHGCCAMLAVLRAGGDGGEILHAGASEPPAGGDGSGFFPLLTSEATLTPMQLDTSPALELVTSDYRTQGWSDAWWNPIPIVFAYRGGKYVTATRDFPAYLKADRKKAVAHLKACKDPGYGADGTAACQRGLGLQIEADDLMLGAPTSAISRLPLPVSIRRWLLAQRKALGKIVD